MRRWLAVLLLVLLPLQSSWAAVAAYCGHESGAGAQHLGHHAHQHAGQPGVDQDSAPPSHGAPAGFDFDCGHCHGLGACMPTPVDARVQPSRGVHPLTPAQGAVRTLAPSPPERPQWRPLA